VLGRASDVGVRKRHAHRGSKFCQGPDCLEPDKIWKYRLRVCNAYPNVENMDIYHRHSEKRDIYRRRAGQKITGDAPLAYKACGDFLLPMKAGDQLEFKVEPGDCQMDSCQLSAGMFQISDLPNNDALMLLVVQRHDTLTNAVAFKSHVFANLLNAQVAVIDAYKGAARGKTVIMGAPSRSLLKKLGRDAPAPNETLRFNGVVAIRPGEWKVALMDGLGGEVEEKDFVALNRESYVVMRTGVEAQHDQPWAQSLVVYPIEDPKALTATGDRNRGGAAELRPAQTTVLLVLMATAMASLGAYF
jgi:hypothetical protein